MKKGSKASIIVLSIFLLLVPLISYTLNKPGKTNRTDTVPKPIVTTTKPSTAKLTTTKESSTRPKTTTPQITKVTTTKPATTLSVEEQNFRSLTMEDKAEIVEWIQSEGMYTNTDDLWEEIAEEYGITEDMVDEINNDPDVAYALGRRNKTRNEATQNSIQYDATLSYGSGTVAVGATKEDLDEFLTNVSNYDTSANSVMVYEGRLALVEEGTKVKVLERKLTTTKVRVLEGLFEGFVGWTIMEAVHNK